MFHAAWGDKWSDLIETVGLPMMTRIWADGIHNLTQDGIYRGFAKCRDELDWPPSIAQFRKACEPPVVRRLLRDILDEDAARSRARNGQ